MSSINMQSAPSISPTTVLYTEKHEGGDGPKKSSYYLNFQTFKGFFFFFFFFKNYIAGDGPSTPQSG